MLTPDIEVCSFDIEGSISKLFGSFDIEVLNYNIEVFDFDIEETSISKYFKVLRYRSTSKYFDIEVLQSPSIPKHFKVLRYRSIL